LDRLERGSVVELGNEDGLQRSYANQAVILQAWGRLEETLALHKKEEALCLGVGQQGRFAGRLSISVTT
jgi:hypothetical protein